MNPSNQARITWLLDQTQRNGGLAPLDTQSFWADQELAGTDPFGSDIPQVPLGIMMSGECVYDELGIAEDYWRYNNDIDWQIELNKAYNDKSQTIVGRRLLSEQAADPAMQWPPVKGLADLFESEKTWRSGSWWLQESAHSEEELQALLNRVDARLNGDLRSFLLPENWEEEKNRLSLLGVPPPRLRGIRGPVTFATSIYGIERFIYLYEDNKPLFLRFRDAILRAVISIADLLDAEAGDAPHGFWFCDDNCCLMTPAMYEDFGHPILQAIFNKFSPNPEDARFQHSDSAMGHLLPLLGGLNLTSVNFGPTVMVDEIRRHMPKTVIHGQLAPFTFSRNNEFGMVAEFLRDFEMAQEHRGLVFSTAGSINNGSRLTGMRLIMSAIQHFGQYS